MMITGENFIAGKRLASGSGKFRTFNPEFNIENEWEFTEATKEELDLAVNEAVDAFRIFAPSKDKVRAALLRKIAEKIEAYGDDILDVYRLETGLTIARGRLERGRTLQQLRMFADWIETENWRGSFFEDAIPDRKPQNKPSLFKTYLPLGPVAVFGASNFPFAYSTAGGDTASALAAGCPVVVKGHAMHAGTGEMVASAIAAAIEELGLHPGIFSNLNSANYETGQQLVVHKGIKAVGFTGSLKGGRALFDLANDREEPIPVFAEMGSVNPVIITQKSLEQEAAIWVKRYADSITNGSGQFCTNPGLLFGVRSGALEKFAHDLAAEITKLIPTVMLHPNIYNAFVQNRNDALEQAGVQLLTAQKDHQPNFAPQTVALVNGSDFLTNPSLHEEVFGPYSLIVACEDKEQIIEIVNRLGGQLTGTIVAQNEELNDLHDLIAALSFKVGRLIFNGVPTGVEVSRGMTHGGPYPATTDSRFTAVGVDAIKRWLRPVTYQNFPEQFRFS